MREWFFEWLCAAGFAGFGFIRTALAAYYLLPPGLCAIAQELSGVYHGVSVLHSVQLKGRARGVDSRVSSALPGLA